MVSKLFKRLKEDIFTNKETEFMPAVVEVVETPPSPVGRILLWTLFVFVVGGLLWAFLGTVDEVAIAPGKVIPQGNVKVVQAEDKGLVKSIYVTEGQKVSKGQVLVELDQTVSAADLAQMKKQVAYYTLEIERLTAEQEGRFFTAPAALADIDPKDIASQMALHQSRMSDYRTKLAAAEATMSQSRANLEIAIANRDKISNLLDVAVDKEQRIEQLVAGNAVAYFTLLDARSRRMELAQSLAAQSAEIVRCQAAIMQSQETVSGVRATWERDIAANLVNDRKELMKYVEELKKAEEKNRSSQIVAPVDGRVAQLAIHTVGGVVTAAQPLMMIVPEDTKLEIEAWVANKDIGFVKEGQVAEIKVESFNFQKYGVLEAEVVNISPDAVESSSEKDKEKNRGYRTTLQLKTERVDIKDNST